MKKMIVGGCMMVCLVAMVGCDAVLDPCPGQEVCDNGCMPTGSVCCGDSTYCNANYTCGPNNSCLPDGVVGGSSCLSLGEETCVNSDGTEDCAPILADCCGNHHYCAYPTVCINGGTACN